MLVVSQFAAAGTCCRRRRPRPRRPRRWVRAVQQADDVGGVSVRSMSMMLEVSQFAVAGTNRYRPRPRRSRR